MLTLVQFWVTLAIAATLGAVVFAPFLAVILGSGWVAEALGETWPRFKGLIEGAWVALVVFMPMGLAFAWLGIRALF
jgi:hypothetical protein